MDAEIIQNKPVVKFNVIYKMTEFFYFWRNKSESNRPLPNAKTVYCFVE